MSEAKETKQGTEPISQEQAAQVGGGDCSITDISGVSGNLIQTYENLIDAASYLIERVKNAV